jgi:hypothetical protein
MNQLSRDSVLCGDRNLADTIVEQLSNFDHLRCRKLRARVLFATNSNLPTFSSSVSGVVRMCSKKQMRWPNANRVVAPVANEKSGTDRPIGELPGEPVSRESSAIDNESTVPFTLLPNPLPTQPKWTANRAPSLIDLGPEAPLNVINICGGFGTSNLPALSATVEAAAAREFARGNFKSASAR